MDEPSCVYQDASAIHCFARGADNTMRHISSSGSVWSTWQSLGGPTGGVEQPTCVNRDSNNIACFARGADGAMWQLLFQPTTAGSTWQSLGGVIVDRPSCVSFPDRSGRIDCFARGTDSAMWHKVWDGMWHDWESQGGKIMDRPSCVSWGPPPKESNNVRIDCFARGTDNAMWHRWFDSGIWWPGPQGERNWMRPARDPVLMEQPSCVAGNSPRTRIDCFTRATNNALLRLFFRSEQQSPQQSGWSYQEHGGVIMERPSCLVWAEDPVAFDCFARGTDNTMWQYHKGAWQTRGPGVIMGQPTCISLGRNAVDCFAHGIDNVMLHNQWR